MQLQALGRKPLLRSLIGVMMLPSNGRLGTLVLLVSYVQLILLSGLYQTLDRVRRGTLLIVMPLSFFRGSPVILCTSSLVHRFSKLPSHFVRRGSMCGIALFLTGGSGHPTCQLHCRSADLRCRCFVWGCPQPIVRSFCLDGLPSTLGVPVPLRSFRQLQPHLYRLRLFANIVRGVVALWHAGRPAFRLATNVACPGLDAVRQLALHRSEIPGLLPP